MTGSTLHYPVKEQKLAKKGLFIYRVGKIDDDKTRNQGGEQINETSSFLYLHPLDHIQFNPKNYAQTLVNTYNVSPVLCNFQNGFSESDANCRLALLLPKKRCLQKKLLNKQSDPEAQYQFLKKTRQNIFIPKIKKKLIISIKKFIFVIIFLSSNTKKCA